MSDKDVEQCRLCLQKRKLCRSHVIPEFFFKPLYNEGKFKLLSDNPQQGIRTRQVGFRERLLCQPCEGLLSPHEKYTREILFGGQGYHSPEGYPYNLSGLDYRHIRLCFLSILWRMGVSALDFFGEVKLGPHADRLRRRIIAQDPGQPHEYGFICTVPHHETDQFFDDLIIPPQQFRASGHNGYNVVLSGVVFGFIVSSHCPPASARDFFIQPDGTWRWANRHVERISFMSETLRSVAHAEMIRSKE